MVTAAFRKFYFVWPFCRFIWVSQSPKTSKNFGGCWSGIFWMCTFIFVHLQGTQTVWRNRKQWHFKHVWPELFSVSRQSRLRWRYWWIRLPVLYTRPSVIFPATEHYCSLFSTKLWHQPVKCSVKNLHRVITSGHELSSMVNDLQLGLWTCDVENSCQQNSRESNLPPLNCYH